MKTNEFIFFVLKTNSLQAARQKAEELMQQSIKAEVTLKAQNEELLGNQYYKLI